MESLIQKISQILREEDDFLIASHINPDGDAIGSSAALGHLLTQMGKKVILYNESGLPERFQWLKLPARFVDTPPDPLPKWVMVVDCGAGPRVGMNLLEKLDAAHTVNIDHHLGNDRFGNTNWIDVNQPAVGCMIAQLAHHLEIPLKGDLAEAIYLAVTTDTGFFTYGNTTPEVMELAAELFRGGLNPGEINPLIRKHWTPNLLKLWSVVMGNLEMHYNGAVAVATVDKSMLERTGTTMDDCEGLINFVRRLKTVRVAAIVRENGIGATKFSMRSHGNDNVQSIATGFGGGGHKNASGGSIKGSIPNAKSKLVAAIGKALELD